ncbi:MAG: biotin--[acetyl-CoA-carboxylase] ligase, partial [Melioribacteraceae bacterium]
MFTIEDFDIKLNTKFVGRNFIYAQNVSSTNSYLSEQNKNLENGSVALSEFQTDGKGRLKRSWYSNEGENLTFSILLNDHIEKLNLNHLNLATSLAVSSSIENLYQLKTDLKWPNDVLINNKKVSGILLESSTKGSDIEKVIIGIGINVNQTKFDGDFNIQPTSIKHEMRKSISREKLLSEVLNTFEELLFELKNDSKKLLNRWRDKCGTIGERISIEHNGESKHG